MGGNLELLFNLIFLGIAIAVFLKLRGVLGRRTGHERPPYDPYSAPEQGKNARAEAGNDKVIALPQGKAASGAQAERREQSWGSIAPEGSDLAQALTEIALADRSFDPRSFLSGARVAYEMIVTSFAAGDRRALRPLLDDAVYASFDNAIGEREHQGLTVEQNFVGIKKADLADAALKDRMARMAVKFVSELTSATKNKDGVVVAGDPVTVREVTDIWTFERDTGSRDPNWRLVATESPN